MRSAEIRAEAAERNMAVFGSEDRPGGVLLNWEGTTVVQIIEDDRVRVVGDYIEPVIEVTGQPRDEPDDTLFTDEPDYPEWMG